VKDTDKLYPIEVRVNRKCDHRIGCWCGYCDSNGYINEWMKLVDAMRIAMQEEKEEQDGQSQ
jgi:hypothetical protein